MAKYLGAINVTDDPQKNPYYYDPPTTWALLFIGLYGGIDGAHHKDWVLDQVARILCGTKVNVFERSWDDGTIQYSFSVDEESDKYKEWVVLICSDENGELAWDYSVGIAP